MRLFYAYGLILFFGLTSLLGSLDLLFMAIVLGVFSHAPLFALVPSYQWFFLVV